ncbi:MAG: Na+/H+ antiporter subunit B [Bacteroidota bacterium]
MNTLILRTATRFLTPLLILFSLFLLWRGHNEPGGGFIGGLVAAGAFALYGLAFGPAEMRRLLRVAPEALLGVGLALAVLSGVAALVVGLPFMTAFWATVGGAKLGTPLVFDVGVYLVVIGFTLLFLLALEDDSTPRPSTR